MRAVLAVVLLLGCSKSSPPSSDTPPPTAAAKVAAAPVAKKPAPTGTWAPGNSTLRITGDGLPRSIELHPSVIAGKLGLSAHKMPIGTVIESGGVRFETVQTFAKPFQVPLEATIADLAWDALKPSGKYQLAQPVDLKLSVSITFPGYETVTLPLKPLVVTTRLEDVYAAMLAAGATWPGESASPPAGPIAKAAAWAFNGFEALGTADKVRDVRFVVTGTMTPNNRTRRCGGYIGAQDFTATSYDDELTITDRFTKQVVATKKFAGQPACPKTVFTSAGSGPSHAEGPSMTAMRSWVTSEVARLGK